MRETAASRHGGRRRRVRRKAERTQFRSEWRSRALRVALSVVLFTAGLAIAGVGVAIGLTAYLYNHYASELIPPEQALELQARGGAKIYDRNDVLIYQFVDDYGGLRQPVPLNDISPWAIKATVSTEDASFYDNPGVNVQGLMRAAMENFVPGQGYELFSGSGGSSITQQLIKNVYILPEDRVKRSIPRKIKETVLALELTRQYGKDEILEWYLNQIFYGNNAYGIGAAAERYFGKHVRDLDLAEASMLAGIPQSPSDYDPYRDLPAAKGRQAAVLDLLVDHGLATPEEAETAKTQQLHFAAQKFPIEAPHFVFSLVEPDIKARFGEESLYRSGLVIRTSIDLQFQKQVEAIVSEEIQASEAICDCHNGAVAVTKPETGEVLAYVGSRDYWNDQIEGRNDNLQAIKQPGSSFKPIVYLSYFMTQHAGPGSVMWATPYKPGGVEIIDPVKNFAGPVPIRTALGSSLNTTAAKAAAISGTDNVIRTAQKLGYTTMSPTDPYGPSIATGGANLKLFEHTFAFATLANNGEMRGQRAVRNYGPNTRRIDPTVILGIEDNSGKVIYQFNPSDVAKEQVVPANYSYLITSIMSDCNARYLIWNCGFFDIGRPYAVKTGTQQGLEQQLSSSTLYNWQVGFTPDLSVGVWIGNQDNRPVSSANFETANAANRVWRRVMMTGHQGLPVRNFSRPPGVVSAPVPALQAGVRGSSVCTGTATDVFATGDATERACTTVAIDKRNGLLASDSTPSEYVEERGFLRVPREEEAWARANGWLPPTEKSAESNVPIRIDQPGQGSTVRGSVLVTGRASSRDLTGWTLEYGDGFSPSSWLQLGSGASAIEGGPLGFFDASRVRPGVYAIRLTVNDQKLGPIQSTVQINVAPPEAATPTPTPQPTATPAPSVAPARTVTPIPTASTDYFNLPRVTVTPRPRFER